MKNCTIFFYQIIKIKKIFFFSPLNHKKIIAKSTEKALHKTLNYLFKFFLFNIFLFTNFLFHSSQKTTRQWLVKDRFDILMADTNYNSDKRTKQKTRIPNNFHQQNQRIRKMFSTWPIYNRQRNACALSIFIEIEIKSLQKKINFFF